MKRFARAPMLVLALVAFLGAPDAFAQSNAVRRALDTRASGATIAARRLAETSI